MEINMLTCNNVAGEKAASYIPGTEANREKKDNQAYGSTGYGSSTGTGTGTGYNSTGTGSGTGTGYNSSDTGTGTGTGYNSTSSTTGTGSNNNSSTAGMTTGTASLDPIHCTCRACGGKEN